MIYKYTKCESVIAKIMADLNLSETKLRTTDIKEWIFEAIEKIGAPTQYIHKETEPMCVEDYQVPIPEDLHALKGVAWGRHINGPWHQTRTTDATFKEPSIDLYGTPECELPPMQYKPITTNAHLTSINGVKYLEQKLKDERETVYFIKPGWVVLNKNNGYVKLAYDAIATDEKGYPLIPDLASYQEAVFWYVVMKMKFPSYLSGDLGGHRKYTPVIYNDIKQNWNFYRNQAYAEAIMPTEGNMRSIKNEWTKLIPDWESDDYFFKENGRRESIYKDYYYGH